MPRIQRRLRCKQRHQRLIDTQTRRILNLERRKCSPKITKIGKVVGSLLKIKLLKAQINEVTGKETQLNSFVRRVEALLIISHVIACSGLGVVEAEMRDFLQTPTDCVSLRIRNYSRRFPSAQINQRSLGNMFKLPLYLPI